MSTTVYVVEPDPSEQLWIRSALASSVDAIIFLDGAALLASPPCVEGACVIASAEPDQAATLKLVRDLRSSCAKLPVIVLGSHSAFRLAVDIARLAATDFLERPVSIRQLRAAVRKALAAA